MVLKQRHHRPAPLLSPGLLHQPGAAEPGDAEGSAATTAAGERVRQAAHVQRPLGGRLGLVPGRPSALAPGAAAAAPARPARPAALQGRHQERWVTVRHQIRSRLVGSSRGQIWLLDLAGIGQKLHVVKPDVMSWACFIKFRTRRKIVLSTTDE